MDSDSLAEALAFLSESLELPDFINVGGEGKFSLIGDGELGSGLHLGALNDVSGDIEPETRTASASTISTKRIQSVEDITSEAAPKRKKKKLNPNKAREERRYDSSTKACATEAPAVWEEICARQLCRRLDAERENIRLKERYQKELKVVKSLERLVYRPTTLQDVIYPETTAWIRRIKIPIGCMEQGTALILNELSAGLEEAYRDVEAITKANIPVPANIMAQKPFSRENRNGMYTEIFDHQIVPFGMRITGDAWWQNWHNYRGQRVQDTIGDKVTEIFGVEFYDAKANTTATFYVQQILRRYREENRIVFVWNAYIEPFSFENERVRGIYFHEQSHVLIKPDGGNMVTTSSEKEVVSTRISTCEILTPHVLDRTLIGDEEVSALSNFMTKSMSSNLVVRREMIENLLLDQALQGCIC
ncbi:unnamed protein product [Phytophthora lilii]|uniref:Unnamed protein product n=1 Tax=Phytophthora lilii TaxID=2077276 RepID=A0A9W6TJM1_9STRA|nr:unnamed protein product [Phytophthora lilii]